MRLFARLKAHYSPAAGARPGFFWRTFFEYALVMTAANIVLLPFDFADRTDLIGLSPARLALEVIVFGPPLETLLFQALSHGIARALKRGPWARLAIVFAPFALAHFFVSVRTGVLAGGILGFYLALVYVVRRQHSFASAFWVTTGFHALSNSIALGLHLTFEHAW